MKRALMVPFIVMVTMFSYPLLSFADYIIHLQSGRQFVTERYWEEGGEIKFHFKQGVLGVPKAAVVSIEEVIPEVPAKEETPPEAAPPEEKKETKKVEEEVKKTEKKEEKKAEQTRPLHEYWAQKKALKVKLDEALKRLREATRNKDKAAKNKAREDMRKFSKEIYKLTDEVKAINNGKLPDYWWQD
jgi:hypothetical protein